MVDTPNHELQNTSSEDTGLSARPTAQKQEELWNEIGFHKPLAGFWYKVVLTIVGLFIGVFLAQLVYNIFFPWPETQGYGSTAGNLFGLYLTLMGIANGNTLNQFMPEAHIKSPRKMLGYIQFAIWYQLFTGAIEVMTISIFTLTWGPNNELAYTIWLMLLFSVPYYTGILGTFQTILQNLQYYSKIELLNFLSGNIFGNIITYGMVYLGRLWGNANPAIGPLMGIAIFNFLKNIFQGLPTWLLALHYFNTIMSKEGITVKDCFGHSFTWDMVKECVIFNLKMSIPGIIGSISGLLQWWIWIIYVPQYVSLGYISSVGSGIAGLIGNASIYDMTPLVSESYMNGKKHLTQYYVGQVWRFTGQVQGYFLGILVIVFFALPSAFTAIGMTYYMAAIAFFIPSLISQIPNPYLGLSDQLQTGANRPGFLVKLSYFEQPGRLFFTYFYIVILALPQKYGITAIIWLMPFAAWFPTTLIKYIIEYRSVHRDIVPIKIPFWQTFGAPAIGCATIILIGGIFYIYFYLPAFVIIGFYPTFAITVILFILMLLLVYYPLTALLGGWDDENLEAFHKAAALSGPSKFIVWPLYRIISAICKHSPLHNKFRMDSDEAFKEAQELLEIKKSHQIKPAVSP